jgi:hypothetical protein
VSASAGRGSGSATARAPRRRRSGYEAGGRETGIWSAIRSNNHYVIEDNPNGDIFACLPDGADRDIKTDGCVKILSVKDSSAEPTGFKFSADGKTAYLAIQHSSDGLMTKVDDYATDDIIKITGFKIPLRFQR